MDPVLLIDESTLHVDPGGEARVSVTIRNPSGANADGLVAEYVFEVLGDAASWASVVGDSGPSGGPAGARVSFLPMPGADDEKQVEVVFRPPLGPGAPAGEVPFGIRCQSRERRDSSAVVEGVVVVGAIHNLEPRLEPVSPRGRWSGRYKLHLANTGTVPANVEVTAEDDKRLLRFAVAPDKPTVPPHETTTVFLSVRPRRPMLRGKVTSHPFVATCTDTGQRRTTPLPGTFDQLPVVPGGVVKAVGALAALAVVVGAFLLLTRNTEPEALTAPTMSSVEPGEPGAVAISWEAVDGATAYSVRLVTEGSSEFTEHMETTVPDQHSLVWSGLSNGQKCFAVVALNEDAKPGDQSASKCADIVNQTTTGESLTGWMIVYGVFPGDGGTDSGAQDLYEHLVDSGEVESLRQPLYSESTAGLPEALIDPGLPFWFVVKDGIQNEVDARAECDAQKAIPDLLAADCMVYLAGDTTE
jgi:hypothetical protein